MADSTNNPPLCAASYDLARKAQDASSAAGDLSRLSRLAGVVVDDLSGWIDRLAGLSCSRPCDLAEGAVLVLGSLFAETLEEPALRVLAAELVRAMGENRGLASGSADLA